MDASDLSDYVEWTFAYHDKCTKCGMLLYRYGNAMRYSVRTGCRIITLLMSLNSFQSSSLHREEKSKKVKKKYNFKTTFTSDLAGVELTQHCDL